ncbi:MAG: SUMF1/EgtB/PvdO family nonheme iron enzyme [Solirubrobacterales bacterium]
MRASSKEAIAQRLAEARERTLELVEALDDEQLNRVYSPLLSPLAWDLGHIANFEELWLVQRIGGREPLHGELGRFYDAIENPRRSRGELPILRDAELRAYLADVRGRTLAVLGEVELDREAEDPLLRGGFVYEMLLAHEHQHNETMLQLLQMVDGYQSAAINPGPAVVSNPAGSEMLAVPGGGYEIGAPGRGFAYDNERPRHTVELADFEIDRSPVTNGAYTEFIEATGAEPPLYWGGDGEGGWLNTAMGGREPIDPAGPVVHVSCEEAEAFARWAAKRLPTEQEWEAARPGLEGVGQVWEWTSSHFLPYPGFEAFPYREYSEVFFGDTYRVLRGASWATHPSLIRASFRNWDLPQRRQIFAGVRCARDAG